MADTNEKKPTEYRYTIAEKGSVYLTSDTGNRIQKATKIQKILGKELKLFRDQKVLDVGTGYGVIAEELAKSFKHVCSVDIVDERRAKAGYQFSVYDGKNLPFESNTFSLIIANHVIEHAFDQEALMTEFSRVLANDGTVYVAVPNWAWVMEPHFELPFIAWLPVKWAGFIVRLFRRGTEYDVRSKTLFGMKRLFREHFETKNLTPEILKSPEKFDLEISPLVSIVRLLPLSVIRLISLVSPTLIFVLKKRKSNE